MRLAASSKLLAALVIGFAAVAVQSQSVCQTYVVQAGDTVSTIAEKFGLRVTDLEAALADCDLLVTGYKPGDFLQTSQRICLPGYVPACLNVQSAGGNEACKYYTVQQGDTFDTIGTSFGIPRQDIAEANPNLDVLPVNSFVKLPTWDASVCPDPSTAASCRVYVAESGDSLSLIATAFSLNLADLQTANTALNADAMTVLQPGQRVKLPPFPDNCGDGVAVEKPSNCRAYNVIPGDTVASIAAMFQTSAADLTASNPELAAGGVLSPGTQVKLPPVDESCVNPTIVSAIPSPPPPPSPPLPPPSPPSPPAEESSPPPPSPPPSPEAEPVAPVVPTVPESAPISAPAPEPIEQPLEPLEPAPAPAPEPVVEEPVEAPAPAPVVAPEPTPAPSSSAASTRSMVLVALLAVIGAAAALF